MGTFEFIPFGEEVDIGDESYGKDGEGINYKSIKEFVKNENFDLLFPSNIIDDINIITITNSSRYKDIHIVFNTPDLFITLELNTKLNQDIKNVCNKKITLNGIDYYICIMEDISQVQAYFIHNNNLYTITYKDEKSLMEILNNMEEIKYED